MKDIETTENTSKIDDRNIILCLLYVSQFIKEPTIDNAKALEQIWNELSLKEQENIVDLLIACFHLETKQIVTISLDLKSINDFILLIDETKKDNFCSNIEKEAEAIRILNHWLE